MIGDGSVFILNAKRNINNKIYLNRYLNISICGTFEFLTELQNQLSFLNSAHVIKKEKRRSTNCYNLVLTSNKRSWLFYDFIYNNSTIYLERKRETFRDYNKETLHKRVMG